MRTEKDRFLEDEVRDGFYVPSMVKRAWWQSLSLLRELDRVCEKYGLHYYLDWGSLIGAARHGGFIPWDDDLDICMHRNDLEKLKAVAGKEFTIAHAFLNFDCSDHHWRFTENLVNTERMNFDETYLREHDGFPYMAAVDIFVLDNVTDDVVYEEKRAQDIRILLDCADLLDQKDVYTKDWNAVRRLIAEKTGLQFENEQTAMEIKRKLYREARRIMMRNNNEETEYVAQMIPWAVYHKRYDHRSYYENVVRVPFEGMEVTVSAYYDALLKRKYGRYAQIYYGGAAHGYPYFEEQAKQLGTDVPYPIPYRFDENCLHPKEIDRSQSWKEMIRETTEYLCGIGKELTRRNGDERLALLQECQSVAIDMGNLIEQMKGEGTRTVAALETYCEEVYRVSVGEEDVSCLPSAAECIRKTAAAEILGRKEVLFVPYKPEYWDALQEKWEEKCKEPDKDVYVAAVPYYYKDYDGRLRDMVYEPERYPSEIHVIAYDTYNPSVRCPDEVYIQSPYDEYNMAVSVHPMFYASNLRKYTQHLAYIPYFTTSDFEQTNYPQMHNMKDYCTMPGVVLADSVLLSSSVLRSRYIEKLTEFAGENTREIWEKRIQVAASHRRKPDDGGKKAVVMACSLSTLLRHGTDYLEHLRESLGVFREQSENIDLIWYVDPWMERQLETFDAALYAAWREIRNEYEKTGWGMNGQGVTPEELARTADAYYGDTTVCLKEFEVRGKPIMLEKFAAE